MTALSTSSAETGSIRSMSREDLQLEMKAAHVVWSIDRARNKLSRGMINEPAGSFEAGYQAGYRAALAAQEDAPITRGEKWERDFQGVLGGVTAETAEAYADRIARKRASYLTADEAAKEYETALAKELGIPKR